MLVIVSGASTGIGRAIVEACLEDGHDVIAGVRNVESLKDLTSTRLKVVTLDVTKPEHIAAMRAIASTDRVVLINNAGVATGGPVEAVSMKDWRDAFDVNVFGLIELTQALLPLLRKTKGLVINIGSVSGLISPPYLGTYAATKFAVRAVSDSLRRELAPFGVQVALFEPGPIQTPIWEKSLAAGEQMRDALPNEMKSVYGPFIGGVIASVRTSARSAVPVSRVTDLILSAMHASKPKPYYKIGLMMKILMPLFAVLPTALVDRLLEIKAEG